MLSLVIVNMTLALVLLQGDAALPIGIGFFIAMFINTALVSAATQYLKRVWPGLKLRYPWLIPIITPVLGIVLTAVSTYLTALLGYQVDLTPILGGITGVLAVYAHQLGSHAGVPNLAPFAVRGKAKRR